MYNCLYGCVKVVFEKRTVFVKLTTAESFSRKIWEYIWCQAGRQRQSWLIGRNRVALFPIREELMIAC